MCWHLIGVASSAFVVNTGSSHAFAVPWAENKSWTLGKNSNGIAIASFAWVLEWKSWSCLSWNWCGWNWFVCTCWSSFPNGIRVSDMESSHMLVDLCLLVLLNSSLWWVNSSTSIWLCLRQWSWPVRGQFKGGSSADKCSNSNEFHLNDLYKSWIIYYNIKSVIYLYTS